MLIFFSSWFYTDVFWWKMGSFLHFILKFLWKREKNRLLFCSAPCYAVGSDAQDATGRVSQGACIRLCIGQSPFPMWNIKLKEIVWNCYFQLDPALSDVMSEYINGSIDVTVGRTNSDLYKGGTGQQSADQPKSVTVCLPATTNGGNPVQVWALLQFSPKN